MIVETKAYGPIEVNELQKVLFPNGLFGFEKFTQFVLMNAHQDPFYILQSTESKDLAFVLIDPFLFRTDYELDISDEILSTIEISNQEDALVFALVTIPLTGQAMTANLAGPVIINKNSRKGIQAVLQDQKWKTKHDIISELAESRSH